MIEQTIKKIKRVNIKSIQMAKRRSEKLLMPKRALGDLLVIAERMAGIKGKVNADVSKKAIVVMVGDHHVAEEGVSAYPQAVTGQMVHGFVNNMAAINSLSGYADIDVKVVDMGCAADLSKLSGERKIVNMKVKPGAANFTKGPAMSLKDAEIAVEKGISIVHELAGSGYGLIGTGDMGIGNTTPSTAIAASVTGRSVEDITGRGTGIDDKGLSRKIEIIKKGLAVNQPGKSDGLDLLAKVGGFEIGGIAGLVLGCAEKRIPVVVDGLISTAGALIAYLLCPLTSEYMFAAHQSVEKAQSAMLDFIGLKPMLDFNMRLGEGTGCALAMPIIEAAVKVHGEMATFEEAGVSKE